MAALRRRRDAGSLGLFAKSRLEQQQSKPVGDGCAGTDFRDMMTDASDGRTRNIKPLLTAVCALAVSLVYPQQSLLPQVPSGPTQNALAGARVFGVKGCVRCHAINGLGGTEGPDFGRFSRPRSFYDFSASMWNHLPMMVERMRALGIDPPQLKAQEIADLIAFLSTVNYFDPAGDVDTGRQLFSEKRCIVCHQVEGIGGVVGPNLDF